MTPTSSGQSPVNGFAGGRQPSVLRNRSHITEFVSKKRLGLAGLLEARMIGRVTPPTLRSQVTRTAPGMVRICGAARDTSRTLGEGAGRTTRPILRVRRSTVHNGSERFWYFD